MMIPRQFDIWNSKNHKPKILKPKLLFSLKNSRNSARLHLKIWLIHDEYVKLSHRSKEKDSVNGWNNRQLQVVLHNNDLSDCMHSNRSSAIYYRTHTTACTMDQHRPLFSIEDVEKGNLPNNNTTTSTINIFIFVQNYK